LLIVLPVATIEHLASQIDDGDFEVDLNLQQIKTPTEEVVPFEINSLRRDCLLQGLDSIELSLTRQDKIKAFQDLDKLQRPWVYQVRVSE